MFSQVLADNPNPRLRVTGSNFVPNSVITIELHSATVVLGQVTTDAAGSFSVDLDVPPGTTGTHEVTASGESCPVNATFTTPGTPMLAFTGFRAVGLGVGALALLAAGVLFIVAGRRRAHH